MSRLLVLSLVLSGCVQFPDNTEPMPCWVHHEVEKLGLGYEARHGVELTAEDWLCLHEPEVGFFSYEQYSKYCGGAGIACYIHSKDGRSAIIFSEYFFDHTEENQGSIIRHEAEHRLLHCLFGDWDPDHSHEDFDRHPPEVISLALESATQVSNYICE